MAKPKTEEILRKQKEAKQKKILFVLGPILLLLVVWQGPGYLTMLTGGGSEPTPTVATPTTPAATDTAGAPDPSSAPAPSTVAPTGTPVADASPSEALPDSDLPASADGGQLVSFGRFLGKDPFKQSAVARSGVADGGTTAPPPDGTSSGGGTTTPPPPTISPPTISPPTTGGSGGDGGSDPGDGGGTPLTPVSAVVDVNGSEETLQVDGTFPSSDPLFRLAKLAKTTIRVGLVGGSFSNGQETVEVKLGKTLTLVSEPDGLRYTIKLVRVKL